MQLNFDRLNQISGNAPEGAGVFKGETGGGLTDLQARANEARREKLTADLIAEKYRANFSKAARIRAAILRGTENGESLEPLFIQACKCIADLTNDEIFYNIVSNRIQGTYRAREQEQRRLVEFIAELMNKRQYCETLLETTTAESEKAEVIAAIEFINKEIDKYVKQLAAIVPNKHTE